MLEKDPGQALARYTARLIALRKASPALRWPHYVHGNTEILPGVPDIAWFDERGQVLSPDAWNDSEARALALRRACVETIAWTTVFCWGTLFGARGVIPAMPAYVETSFSLVPRSAAPHARDRPRAHLRV